MSNLADADPIAFVATAKPDAARKFYTETLGLRFVSDDQFAMVFDLHGTTLRIEKVPALEPHQHTTLGWKVPEIATTMALLSGRGVRFERYDSLPQDDRGVWTAPGGAKIAWFKDPDGNTLSLTECRG